MTEDIFFHHITPDENLAFGFFEPGEEADYREHTTPDKKKFDIALLYLYRLKLRAFQFYLSNVKDDSLLDSCDEMIREAFQHKFSGS